MVVERAARIIIISGGPEGQSVLEFLLILPVVIAMTMLMVRSNTVIQMSIVDQKYGREQLFFINGNGADYPRRNDAITQAAAAGTNQIIAGVSENQPGADDEGSSQVAASTYYIARKPNQGDNATAGEVSQRGLVRVRNTVSICLPLVTTSRGGQTALPINASGARIPYNLPENPTAYTYCSQTNALQNMPPGDGI